MPSFFWDKLMALLEKLPGGLQKSIIRELTPIRELFFDQRAARILLLGDEEISVRHFLESLSLPDHTAVSGYSLEQQISLEGDGVARIAQEPAWQNFRHGERGEVFVLDGRIARSELALQQACKDTLPDVVIFFQGPAKENFETDIKDAFNRFHSLCDREAKIPIIGVAVSGVPGDINWLRNALIREVQIDRAAISVWPWSPDCFKKITTAICGSLPNSSRLEFARFSDATHVQSLIANSLLKSFAGICGIIGMQPIPLADLPILIAIQSLMIAAIAYISGRSVRPQTITEFAGALGINIGAAMLFREGARALVKVLPIWGNAVSGFVAGVGTYAIGKAAIAYFIEDRPITEAKQIFQRLLRKKNKRLLR